MSTLNLALLGGFNADVDGRDLEGLPTRKARALLAILATAPDHRQPRESLAAMLWDRSAEEQARASVAPRFGDADRHRILSGITVW